MKGFKIHISNNILILLTLIFVGVLTLKGKADPAIVVPQLIAFATTAFNASKDKDNPP